MKKNSGFVSFRTLVFTVVIVILIVVCVFLFTGYVQTSYQIKADSTAQKVFDAAQDYLDRVKGAGKLQEFNRKAKHFGKAISMELQEEILLQNMKGQDSQKKLERFKEKFQEGDIRYLVLESEEAASDNREDNPLFDIFDKQITDENVWKDTFLLEYDSVTGKVLTVFYSREADKLKYEGEKTNRENVVLRQKELLKQKKQGYYGVNWNELLD